MLSFMLEEQKDLKRLRMKDAKTLQYSQATYFSGL